MESSPEKIVRALQQQLGSVGPATGPIGETISSGCRALDRLLPHGGFRRGTLVEWLSGGRGSGAASMALLAALQACRQGGTLVVLDRPGQFYPPAAAAWGIDLNNAIVIRPTNTADELWALDQALRCSAVAAVWGPVEKLDGRSFRRLQLAAEMGGGLGLLLRGAQVRGRPTWSDVQLAVEPRPCAKGRRLRIEVVRCRGAAGGAVEVEIDETTAATREVNPRHETHSLHLVSQLAYPTTPRRQTGAKPTGT